MHLRRTAAARVCLQSSTTVMSRRVRPALHLRLSAVRPPPRPHLPSPANDRSKKHTNTPPLLCSILSYLSSSHTEQLWLPPVYFCCPPVVAEWAAHPLFSTVGLSWHRQVSHSCMLSHAGGAVAFMLAAYLSLTVTSFQRSPTETVPQLKFVPEHNCLHLSDLCLLNVPTESSSLCASCQSQRFV